jgi:DNA-binding SARP family transcriptional activator
LFWAEYPTATSRTYLRNALWRLRALLSETGAHPDAYLKCTNGGLSFRESGPFRLDVEEFESAAAAGRSLPGGQLSAEQVRSLEEADRLYAGDLLEDAYDDWCLYDRERLRLLHQDLLSKLLAHHEAAGTYDCGVETARRLLALDPTREKVHRQAMRLHWLMGNPVEAVAQYRRCAQILLEELGIQPTAKTNQLHEQMLRNEYDPSQWPVHGGSGLPKRMPQARANNGLGRKVLERIGQLEKVASETASELHELRLLLEKALASENRLQ